ncbi:hypothetical protein BGX27_002537 [Mortierella sp. AM989]|nr:hypothetical protein BGX27_002537 [Mortierella sp. AM989]
MDGLFDRVLKLRGLKHVLKQNEGNDMVKCMRGVHGGLMILLVQILVLILTFPVNFIPVLGQMIFASVNGWVLTFGLRFHYDAEIRNISVMQSRREAWQRKREYMGFGAVAVGFEMIPIANILFVWTNIVGCALWVADEIEKNEAQLHQENPTHSLMGGQVPNGLAPLVDVPPEYTQGNHFNMSGLSGQQQYDPEQQHYSQQQQQYHPSQSQVSFSHQGTSGSPFTHQGSPRIPPKNRKHPDLDNIYP